MTTRKVNKPVVLKENCFEEEIKEVELRSRRWKFIYNRTYNPVGLNKVSNFFQFFLDAVVHLADYRCGN